MRRCTTWARPARERPSPLRRGADRRRRGAREGARPHGSCSRSRRRPRVRGSGPCARRARRSLRSARRSRRCGDLVDRTDHRARELQPGARPLQRGLLGRQPPAGLRAVHLHVHLREVEIDPETGKVKVLRYVVAQDVGKAINPRAVVGQIEGGVVQGSGYTLYEDPARRGGSLPRGPARELPPPDARSAADRSHPRRGPPVAGTVRR